MALSQVLLLLLPLLTIAGGNIFTSSFKMRKLALREDVILSKLDDIIQEQTVYLEKITSSYLQLTREYRAREPDQLSHPNGLYLVVKRFSVRYIQELGGTTIDIMQEKLLKDVDPIYLANGPDFDGALQALIRIQTVYNMTARDMIKGDFRGRIGPPLAFDDAYYIGRMAYVDGNLDFCKEWLELALELREKDKDVAKDPLMHPSRAAIKALLGRRLVLIGSIRAAKDIHMEAYVDEPRNGDVAALQVDIHKRPRFHQPAVTKTQANYSRLCQHREPFHIETPNYQAMKCRYKSAMLPYYVFKEEILSLSPYVSLFYGVFVEDNLDFMKKSIQNKLARGLVMGDDKKGTVSTFRTSDLGWLPDEESAYTAALSKRIGSVLGLNVRKYGHAHSGEDFQVVNYGLGGHYDVHLDPFIHPDASGNRIATFLIYLSDVEEGGNTIFSKAGISVAPIKGTALLWYSYPPSFDEKEDLTHHAGCPVVVGEKWIANKWIRSYGNEYYRPCGLHANATQLEIEDTMVLHQRNLCKI